MSTAPRPIRDLARAAWSGDETDAGTLAATHAVTVETTTPLGEAAELMIERGVTHLVVTDGAHDRSASSRRSTSPASSRGAARDDAPALRRADIGVATAQSPTAFPARTASVVSPRGSRTLPDGSAAPVA